MQFLTVGKISCPFGILGWMKFYSFTEIKSQVFTYYPWYYLWNNTHKIIYLSKWKPYKNFFLIKIKSIDNRTIAGKYNHCKIVIQSNSLPILKHNNYYLKDIINCQIINSKNIIIGTVIDIITSMSNDILIVKNIKSKGNLNKEILIPFVLNKTILNINISKKIILVNWTHIIEKK